MSAERRTIPRTLSCLVKGPLGCFTFLLGATVVFVLFFPPAGGRLARGFTEEWFGEHHAGKLEIGDAWVGSLYGPQRVESLVLRDPDDEEVLRGSLHAPSFEEFRNDPESYGPIVFHVASLRLVEEPGGTTNLSRALARRGAIEDPGSARRGGFTTDRPIDFALEVRIDRLRYESADGAEGELADTRLTGALTWGPYQRVLRLAGGVAATEPDAPEPVEIRIELAQAVTGGPWTLELELARAPAALASVACPGLAPLARRAGPVVDELLLRSGNGKVAVHLGDEGATFDASGERTDGEAGGELDVDLRGDVLGGPSASLALRLPCGTRHAAALTELLPFVAALECEDAGDVHVLRLEEARWPLGAGAEGPSGQLFLELAPSRATLAPPLQALAAGADAPAPLRAFLGGDARSVSVRGGVLVLERFALPLERGRLELEGTHAPASGATELEVSGELAGEALAPVRLVGVEGTLAPAPAALPSIPEAPPVPAGPLPASPDRDQDRDDEG